MRWVFITAGVIAALVAVLLLRAPSSVRLPESASPSVQAPVAPGRSRRAAAQQPVDAGQLTALPMPSIDLEHAPESRLLAEATALLPRDPARALVLIEAADRRFGSEHEGRRALEIEALVGLERIGQSHAKAEHFYRRYPESAAKLRIEQLTGYHPRPWGPSE